ncbi:7-methylxanthosine synthase 1-like [Eucalyptus grandis]|uniref:7-methylxanthosine synthase 1-like n=1 Tax=Eucalyptus grandis TaxID=71139 RepID=UPI00192E7D72|nr:7-methylxanthosine synthase 1-like [Eucalyptus grandis]
MGDDDLQMRGKYAAATIRAVFESILTTHFGEEIMDGLFEKFASKVSQSIPSFYEELRREKGGDFGPCFTTAMPGNFYGRLFPNRSLHFIHSSYGVHWRSQVPCNFVSEFGSPLNKGNAKPQERTQGILGPFQEGYDFVPHVSFGRVRGLIEEEKLDNCNVPCYLPTPEEVRHVIQEEGSFHITRVQAFKVTWDAEMGDGDVQVRGKYVAASMRANTESILAMHFGEVMDGLFERFARKVSQYTELHIGKYFSILVSIKNR